MLKVELTENYAGVKISGDYEDLNCLYDSINYLIKNDTNNTREYMMQNHLYAFLYDVRHAYQAQREVKLIDNNFSDSTRKWFQIKKGLTTDNNVYFCFNCLITDIILDMILVKYFISKIKKKDNNIYNSSINMVNYFYSLVLDLLEGFLPKIKFNKLKNKLSSSTINDKIYVGQWFEKISIEYAYLTKEQRELRFMYIMNKILNYKDYQEYYDLKEYLDEMCKKEKCNLVEFEYDNYPEEIDW